MPTLLKYYKSYFSSDINHFMAVILLSLFPIFFFIGTASSNLFIIILNFLFIIEIIKKKKINFLNNITFYSLLSFWFILLLNLFFSIDPLNSLGRSFGFIRFIFLVMLILYYFQIKNKKYQNLILSSWMVVFFILSADLVFEMVNGKNILGFESYMDGRLTSFFGDELIVGHFYYALILIISFLLMKKFSNNEVNILGKKLIFKNFFYFFIIIFLFISFSIGERSNFLRVLVMLFLFSFIFERSYLKIKLLALLSIFLILGYNIYFNQHFRPGYFKHLIEPFFENPVNYVVNSKYGKHYKAALEVYDNNKFFGVGLKNYRIETKKPEYVKFDSSIHPHQTHFEILSELGIVGYIFFILFFLFHFYLYFKRNKILINLPLAGFLFIFTSLIPMLPTGSFFTSHAAILFWINFAFMNLTKNE